MKELVVVKQFSTDCLKSGGLYSFMNFASLGNFFESNKASDVKYFCDGMLMAAMLRLVTGEQVERVSFDYTSIATFVLDYAVLHRKRLYFIGATENEINTFVEKTKTRFPSICIAGYRNGFYPDDREFDVLDEIVDNDVDIVIAGLGAGKQELFLKRLTEHGFKGVGFTCGGFIRQEAASKKDYYPKWVNSLNLRAFYRMYKEPHTIRRYCVDYPYNFVVFIKRFSKREMVVEFHEAGVRGKK
jgi:exopolysaccharide biosynthesis WecB/TagA/CpsF family protein